MARAPQPHDPLIGKVLDGRYEMLERIGEGGMGVVYKAKQLSIDRIIAVKMLNAHMAADPNWVKRFNNEAKACSQLQHPNTIRLFDFGQTKDHQLFMAMEFLAGQSLREAISAGAPMAAVRVLKILIQCNASLAEAHSYNIIHRDIKPDNVFLLNLAGSPDFVKLLDFSVAKLLENDAMRTQAGVVFGTPQYMSPEQGRGLPLSPRSDLYALGILAYEMLTGRVPFTDENPMLVLNMHLRQQVPPLPAAVPQAVQQIVMRALSKKPEERHQNATEMMQHCQQVFAQLGAQSAGMMAPSPQAVQQVGGPPPAQHMQHGAPSPQAPRDFNRAQSAHAHAAPDQRTMIGEPLPKIPSAAEADAMMGRGGAPAAQKTMMAPAVAPPDGAGGMPAPLKTMIATDGLPPPSAGPPPMIGKGPPSMPPGVGPNAPPTVGSPPPGASPNKTMMLQGSEGVVSFANSGGLAPAAPPPAAESTNITRVEGATPLFWIICLVVGLGVGVLAYLAVLQLGK